MCGTLLRAATVTRVSSLQPYRLTVCQPVYTSPSIIHGFLEVRDNISLYCSRFPDLSSSRNCIMEFPQYTFEPPIHQHKFGFLESNEIHAPISMYTGAFTDTRLVYRDCGDTRLYTSGYCLMLHILRTPFCKWGGYIAHARMFKTHTQICKT